MPGKRKRPRFCRSYKFVWIRSKCALLILFITVMGPLYGGPKATHVPTEVKPVYYVLAWLVLPVLGILTDTKFGRYKTLLALQSVRVLFSVIQLLILALQDLYTFPTLVIQIVHTIMKYANLLGKVWFSTVVFTFGLDQLLDSPSTELSVFIHVRLCGATLVERIQATVSAIVDNPALMDVITPFICYVAQISFLLSLVLSRKTLNIQPPTKSPVKLLAKVLRYAACNRHPKRRSAFTYWQEKEPSRLDLGKEKFGGPFTEEEVEDVKTFFRLIPLILVVVTVHCLNAQTIATSLDVGQENPMNLVNYITDPGTLANMLTAGFCFFHLCIVFPFHHRHRPSMLKRMGIGCFATATGLALLSVMKTLKTGRVTLPKYVYYLPSFPKSLAFFFIVPIVEEFCYAQTPHSMKGFALSVLFAWLGLVNSMLAYIPDLFLNPKGSESNNELYWSISLFALALTFAIVYSIIAKRYRLRVRQEIYHAHYVVENIFEDEFDRRDLENRDVTDSYGTHLSDSERPSTLRTKEYNSITD